MLSRFSTQNLALIFWRQTSFIGSLFVAVTFPKPQAFLTCSGARTDYIYVAGSVRQALTRPQNRPWAPARETATTSSNFTIRCWPLSTFFPLIFLILKGQRFLNSSWSWVSCVTQKLKIYTSLTLPTLCRIKTESVSTSCSGKLICQ